LPIYAHKRVLEALEKRFEYIFETENRYPGAPAVIKNQIYNAVFKLGDIDVVPINGMHHQLQVFGFKFNGFAYLTDMKTVDEQEIEKIKGVKVLVINALREKPHLSHFNLEEALKFIDKVKPERAYLTHISHLLGFHDDVQQKLPDNVFLAYDNLQITI
jgi:phosphoribosyl 1,2-cyclic phosphate phosphodiesterase